MRRRILSSRPSPAMVVACIALVIALGGTGYAAIKLPRNSVGNKQLRSNAVTSAKVRNGTLSAKDFQSSALKRGPRGPQGPKGDSAPGAGAVASAGFASRDLYAAGLPFINLTATPADVVGLDVAAGSAGYVASSGRVTATGPSRLVASGEGVLVNASGADADASCSIAVVGSDVRPIGSYTNTAIRAGAYMPVSVSAGSTVEAGTYDVRLRCYSSGAASQFHRGNLVVSITPR